jgi:hypothetical protein
MRARSNFRSNRSHLWNQPRLHPLTPIYLCRPSPTCRKTATISPPNPAHPASLTTPEAASCEIALRTNRRSTATASTLASRRPKVPAMPYRKSYTCPTSSTPTSQGPTHPAPTASPSGLSSDTVRWQKSEAVAATPSRTWRTEHGQRRPRAGGRVVQHEAKGVAGAGGSVPVDGGRVEERSPRLREHGRRCALTRWEDRARVMTPTSLRSGHATRGKSSSRRRRRRTWGRGRAAERSSRLREREERGDECVSLPELASCESLLRLPPGAGLGRVVTASPARG